MKRRWYLEQCSTLLKILEYPALLFPSPSLVNFLIQVFRDRKFCGRLAGCWSCRILRTELGIRLQVVIWKKRGFWRRVQSLSEGFIFISGFVFSPDREFCKFLIRRHRMACFWSQINWREGMGNIIQGMSMTIIFFNKMASL